MLRPRGVCGTRAKRGGPPGELSCVRTCVRVSVRVCATAPIQQVSIRPDLVCCSTNAVLVWQLRFRDLSVLVGSENLKDGGFIARS